MGYKQRFVTNLHGTRGAAYLIIPKWSKDSIKPNKNNESTKKTSVLYPKCCSALLKSFLGKYIWLKSLHGTSLSQNAIRVYTT